MLVLHLYSDKKATEHRFENWGILKHQNAMQKTLCSLFPIHCQFPKLDVAGSIPVSRSNRSMVA